MKDFSAPNRLLVLCAQLTTPSLTLVLLILPILPSTDETRCDKTIFCTMCTIAMSRTNPEQEFKLMLN